MKHNIEELYTIEGYTGLYTKEYLESEEIPVKKVRAKLGEARVCRYYTGANKKDGSVKIYEPLSMRIGYMYGEKTWFDTMEERDAYRAKMNRK